jgi:FkbM family methyltransferase
MILAIAFCERDQDLMLKNIQWWNELGGCKGHKAMLWRDRRTNLDIAKEIQAEAFKCFDDVLVFTAGAEIDGWPEGANYFMRIASGYIQNKNERYFLWMEPDAIPLTPGWMDKLEEEYKKAGKAFMGDRVEVNDVPLHMSGIGIYWNPLHEKAGEAYRAHEVAWDIAAKDQIVPNVHWTELIEHAWKHPTFKSIEELDTQIHHNTILFHSSKDGSLIDLLRQKRGGRVAIHSLNEPDSTPGSPSPLLRSAQGNVSTFKPDDKVTCDIFIRTYPKDYDWLYYSLISITYFCTGFRKIWIVSPEKPPVWWGPFTTADGIAVEWKVMNEEAPDGYLAQQITKLYADVITDYQADYILHVDSDVIFTQSTTPGSFFGPSGNILWPYTPYSTIETPWKPITEKFMQCEIENEFMRRFPIMMPRWLYGKLREFSAKQHKQIISQYIVNQPARAFSEFNALGAYAWKFHHDAFEWVNTVERPLPLPYAKQFFSWGGITDEVKQEIDTILDAAPVLAESSQRDDKPKGGEARESTKSVTPVMASMPRDSRGGVQTPPGVKALPNGIWVIEGDTHVSQWIEQQGRLDHDMNTLPFILPYIKEGDTVVDAGAFIGDHTIAYAKAVGERGKVYAFEPSPIAFECLKHNMEHLENVTACEIGLGDKTKVVPLSGNNGNHGGAYVGEHMKLSDITLERLDDFGLQPDLIKFDIEGCEVKALHGAEETISKYHPTLIIEVNEVALERQKATPKEIFMFLEVQGYRWKIMQENCKATDPMFDIIAWHDEKPMESPRTPRGEMEDHVKALADYAARGNSEKIQVAMQLRKHKIVKRNKEILKKGKKK